MSSNSKNQKNSTRRKKSEEAVAGIHEVPHEFVEIERNLIENWLLSLKHWFQMNLATARKIIFGTLAALVLVFIAVFIHSAVIEKQNSDFYSALLSFDNAKKYKAEKVKYEAKINELLKNSNKLCSARWSTRYSNAGCLLSAMFYNELSNTKEAAEYLNKFSAHSGNEALSIFTAYFSAYYAESENNFDQALKLVEALDKKLEKNTNRDVALFQKGRLLYYSKKNDEAQKAFKEILDKYKNGPYAKKAREYITLIKLSSATTAEKATK